MSARLSRLPRLSISPIRPAPPLRSPILHHYTPTTYFTTSPSPLIKGAKNSKEHTDALRQKKLKKKPPHEVTTTSTVRTMFEGQEPGIDDSHMAERLKTDIKTVKKTFTMENVPPHLTYMGLAGLVPYVVTSCSSLFVAWDVSSTSASGTPYLFNRETAQQLLDILEPVQVGYGAVILSFLGAIHWGLEFAAFGGQHGYKRYAIGILAPMLAWPTTLLPHDYALLAQFVGFTGMYLADSTATAWGWAPTWYTNYRFFLTFVVGGCIVLTLIARSMLGDQSAARARSLKGGYFANVKLMQREQLELEEKEMEERELAKRKGQEQEQEKLVKVKKVEAGLGEKSKVEPIVEGKGEAAKKMAEKVMKGTETGGNER